MIGDIHLMFLISYETDMEMRPWGLCFQGTGGPAVSCDTYTRFDEAGHHLRVLNQVHIFVPL